MSGASTTRVSRTYGTEHIQSRQWAVRCRSGSSFGSGTAHAGDAAPQRGTKTREGRKERTNQDKNWASQDQAKTKPERNRPNGNKPDQAKPDQTKAEPQKGQTRPDQNRPKAKQHQGKLKRTRPNRIETGQAKSDQTRLHRRDLTPPYQGPRPPA